MHFYQHTPQEVEEFLKTDLKNGLTEKEAARRLAKNNKNILYNKKKKSIIRRFFEQFDDFMITILLIAAAVSFVTSMMFGDKNITEPVIILAIVTLNALLGTIQEARAEHSLEELKKLSSPTATVIRSGKEIKINSQDVVTGDILKLKSGDVVCADARLTECNNLTVNEAALTGEANDVAKNADIVLDKLTPMSELCNMVMASCSVTSGTARAVVVKTGMHTEVGKIASMLISCEEEETPLQKRLAKTGKTLGIAALFICGIIFFIGIFRHIPPFEMFMTSVSLAVAAIPEGLPAIVTILLALGVMRMSKHNAIVRHLQSVETLGCATVICTDKTGTLTENKMKVAEIKSKNISLLLRLATLCTEDGSYINPTDRAILNYAQNNGIETQIYKNSHKLKDFVPFNSSDKKMSVLCDGKCIVKGAPERVLSLCTQYCNGKDNVYLTSDIKKNIIKENEEMTKDALRVIAVAYKPSSSISEENLIFAGLFGIYDPPRHEAKKAVKVAKDAGINTIIITGDHANTALAIARKTGIANDDETAVSGNEIDEATDAELWELFKTHHVFARVTPEHKLRIVNILKKNGEICAMTGDGVNDAPALKGADIGCSMGITGTDVAKSASDIILTDDNFATIVYAVKEGRAIYDNIKKSVKFLLSSNIGEILTVFFGIIFNSFSPLTAIELLWVNLVTDSLPALALGLDTPEKNIMKAPVRDKKNNMFSPWLWSSIALEGMMIGALALLGYAMGLFITNNPIVARTMSFFVLAVSQLTHAFNMHSEKSVLNRGIISNKYLVMSFIAGLFAQIFLMYFKPAAALFNICPLNASCLLICILLSVLPLFIVELQKKINQIVLKKH